MAYYNYHAKIKDLIEKGHLVRFEFTENWNGIRPALVLYFDNHAPMPVREHRFSEYRTILEGKHLQNQP